MKKDLVLILDCDGVSGQLAARRVRECHVYSEVKPAALKRADILATGAKAVILAGGESAEAQKCGLPVFSYTEGKSENAELKEFFSANRISSTWTMEEYAREYIEFAAEHYKGKKVLLALSGGVDSSVCAMLLAKAIGKDLTCIFVDTGLMRKNEGAEVAEAFGSRGDINFISVDAEQRFLTRLAGVTDPERKRKIIGEEFIRVFEEEAKKIGAVDYLVQGTIYPDIIESGLGGKAVKSHHNVGGLPDVIEFKEIIEPVKYLFKQEVRELGRVLGLPEYLYKRQPFPGPGLSVRCIGEVTKARLDILRDADYIFRTEVAAAGLDNVYSQYFVVITDMKSVGVRNGERTYEYIVSLRAVNTSDFMTAEWAEIPHKLLKTVSSRITSEVKGISRVVYDITSKPPATIEWE